MKRLTVHLNRVNKKTYVENGKSKSHMTNTLSFFIKNDNDVTAILTDINENHVPRNNVKSWYLSNIK